MVGKSYLKYENSHNGGLIVSSAANYADCIIAPNSKSPSVVVPALEGVALVALRTGKREAELLPVDQKPGSTTDVTSVRCAVVGENTMIMVGYASGHVGVFRGYFDTRQRATRWSCQLYAPGHKADTGVLALALDKAGVTMCSGGQDTDITVWDVMAQEALYRMRGHRGAVVSLELVSGGEGGSSAFLISGSADGLVKVWNLAVQQCVQTVVASDAQVTCCALDLSGTRLFVGLRDDLIKVFDTTPLLEEGKEIVPFGAIHRKHNKPVTSFAFADNAMWMAAATSHSVEVFMIHTPDDVKKKIQRKKKRKRTEGPGAVAGEDTGALVDGGNATVDATIAEEVSSMKLFRFDEKLKAVRFVPGGCTATEIHFLATYADNAIRTFVANVTEADAAIGGSNQILSEPKSKFSVLHAGHRTAIRDVQFTDNDAYLLTVSHDACKLWTPQARHSYAEREQRLDEGFHDGIVPPLPTLVCSGSYVLGEAAPALVNGPSSGGGATATELSCCAVAGSELACIGDNAGRLHLVTLPAMDATSSVDAHVGGVTAVVSRGASSGAATGFTTIGADRRLVEWGLVLRKASGASEKVVTLSQLRELELTEQPTAIAYAPNAALLAVALADNTVQLFYSDTLKPFVSLYGHKLPVTRIAFADEGQLVATVGMDKSLRFWGTDFGDCHRAIHAHDDYITALAFLPGTHFCFTASLDGSIKHWDGDTWTMIQSIRLHQRGVWALAASRDGSCVATAGIDRAIRLFQRSDEMIFPEEEEERLAQEAMDEETARRQALSKIESGDVAAAVTSTSTTNAAETLMEAIDNVSVELQRQQHSPTAAPHPALRNRTVWQYMWAVLESIKPSELRHATAALTSIHVNALLSYLDSMIENGVVSNFEVAAKVLLALVKPAPGTSSASRAVVLATIDDQGGVGNNSLHQIRGLRIKVAQGLGRSKDRLGFAMAGLKFVADRIQETKSVRFFDVSKVQGAKKKYHSRAIADTKPDH